MRCESTLAAVLLFGLSAATLPCAAQQEPELAEGSASAPSSMPTFAGELDVTVINLFVTVLDDNGNPVTGLTHENFAVYEHDQQMEISNFSEIKRDSPDREFVRARSPQPPESQLTRAIDADDERNWVALLFDNLSLTKANRNKVLKSLREFVAHTVDHGDQVMVATLDAEFRVLEPFTTDSAVAVAALDALPDTLSFAGELSGRRRVLKREIMSVEVLQNEPKLFAPRGGGPGGTSNTTIGAIGAPTEIQADMVTIRASGLMGEIEKLRSLEAARIRRSLRGIDETVRSLAALPGRKHVVWIGEGLPLQPSIDCYSTFYNKFKKWDPQLNLVQPEMWLPESRLESEFAAVAAAAQVSGTTLHVVDAKDRDRELAASGFSSVENNAFLTSEEGGNRPSAQMNLAQSAQLVDGAAYLARATGGTFSVNTRDFNRYFDDLETLLGSYYSIGYRQPGDPDGSLRPVRIALSQEKARVHHQEQVLSRAPVQCLADATLSRLRFGIGENPLAMSVSLGDIEPVDEERSIHTIRLRFPTDMLTLIDDDGTRVDEFLVVFQALNDDGFTKPPQLMPLSVSIPASRVGPGALAQTRVRLLVDGRTERIAVGALEYTSGLRATTVMKVPPVDS